MKQHHHPRQIFKKLVNKNATKVTKPKIWGPLAIFPESLDPTPRVFDKNFRYPLPWIFYPCASKEYNGLENCFTNTIPILSDVRVV